MIATVTEVSSAGILPGLSTAVALRYVREWREATADQAHPAEAAPSVAVLAAVLAVLAAAPMVALAAVPTVVLVAAPLAALAVVVLAVVPSVVVHTVALAAAVPSVVVHTVALAVVVPSVVARMVAVTAVDTAVEVAEWADIDKSEHQFPDFRIRHPRNLAH